MARSIRFTYDNALALKDAGLVAASAAATVGGSAKVLDVGAGFVCGTAVIDISAIEVASGDEVYTIGIQGSNSATFASGIVTLGEIRFGDSSVNGKSADDAAGRYLLMFTNEQADTQYRYVRAYTTVAGTVATGINYTAFVSHEC